MYSFSKENLGALFNFEIFKICLANVPVACEHFVHELTICYRNLPQKIKYLKKPLFSLILHFFKSSYDKILNFWDWRNSTGVKALDYNAANLNSTLNTSSSEHHWGWGSFLSTEQEQKLSTTNMSQFPSLSSPNKVNVSFVLWPHLVGGLLLALSLGSHVVNLRVLRTEPKSAV